MTNPHANSPAEDVELKETILSALRECLMRAESWEIETKFGFDEFSGPELKGIIRREPNDTVTIILKINGGAIERRRETISSLQEIIGNEAKRE